MTSLTPPSLSPASIGRDLLHPLRAWQTPEWVLSDLQRMADGLKEGDTVAEVGVASSGFARSLAVRGALRLTIDLPVQPSSSVPLSWPVRDESLDFVISFDAVQFISDIPAYVRELGRVTRASKICSVIFRNRDDIGADGLVRFFPSAAEAAKASAPETSELERLLADQSLYCVRRATLQGHRRIDAEVLRAIAHRDIIGLADLTQAEFEAGVLRMREAVAQGDAEWPSQYTILVCRKVRPTAKSAEPGASSAGMGGGKSGMM